MIKSLIFSLISASVIPLSTRSTVYFNHGNLFIKRFDPFSPDKKYPDNNVNFETYTSKFIAEVETLSELTVINPGETVSHRESWQLVADVKRPENEQELLNTIEKYK